MSPRNIVILIIRLFGLYMIVANIPPIIMLLLSGDMTFSAFVGMGAYLVVGYLALIRAEDLTDWVMRDLGQECPDEQPDESSQES